MNGNEPTDDREPSAEATEGSEERARYERDIKRYERFLEVAGSRGD